MIMMLQNLILVDDHHLSDDVGLCTCRSSSNPPVACEGLFLTGCSLSRWFGFQSKRCSATGASVSVGFSKCMHYLAGGLLVGGSVGNEDCCNARFL